MSSRVKTGNKYWVLPGDKKKGTVRFLIGKECIGNGCHHERIICVSGMSEILECIDIVEIFRKRNLPIPQELDECYGDAHLDGR